MTLIDKAALLNRIATEVHYDSEHSLEMYAKLLSEINDAPDALIRCKDCIHYWKNNPSDDVPVCLASPKDDAFCSEGERKEDVYADPDMYPCRVCDDYDRKRGCISKDGCGERREDAETN